MISFATLNASIAPSSAAPRKPPIFPRSRPSLTKSMSASSRDTRPKKPIPTALSIRRSLSSTSWCAASRKFCKKNSAARLGDKGVHILDPFVGTGNFIVRMMQEIKTTDLQYKYENELHCNEVMLLPYYIASMNIEHAYFDRVGEYKAFPGICLVDTFELAEAKQSELSFMTAANAERVKRQRTAPIFVVIGNPPYNAWQADENDNNKNRKYPAVDARLTDTYAKDSSATNKVALRDPYIKAIRWASDRL